jgi:uncharacterized protein YbjT (DUF2867 family)
MGRTRCGHEGDVIDGAGGGVGRALVEGLKKRLPGAEVVGSVSRAGHRGDAARRSGRRRHR